MPGSGVDLNIMQQFADEWLVPSVEPLVKTGEIAVLRQLEVDEPLSLWETLVQRKVLTD